MKPLNPAYQANVLLRQAKMITVGTRFPFKDQLVITTENTYRHPEKDMFTYSHRIDVVIPTENRNEALKLNVALRKYFRNDEMMLPLHVGVFQKPYTAKNQKSRKHYAYSTINGKDLLEALPNFEKQKDLKYSVGSSPVESDVLVNGFDLTYLITEFDMEHFIMEEDFETGKPLENPMYRLSLYTTSIFENEEEETEEEEILLFHINAESESELMTLAKKLQDMQHDKTKILECKDTFPKQERDYYSVNLREKADDFIKKLGSNNSNKKESVKTS